MTQRRTLRSAALTAALLATAAGCKSGDLPNFDEPVAKLEAATPEQAAGFAKASNAFAFDLSKEVGQTKGNYVFSPASISMALTMTFAGARGETADEMRKVLHLEGSPDEVSAAAGRFIQGLEATPAPITIRVANRLFGEKTTKFSTPFLDGLRASFGAPLVKVNFRTGANDARVSINDWAAKHTEQHIPDLFPEGSVNADSRLVIGNAIYFLGPWSTEFEAHATRGRPFTRGDESVVEASFMRDTRIASYAHVESASAITLPYKGGAMSMLVVLPDAKDGLPALEASLDASKLDALVKSLARTEVAIALPKFEIKPDTGLALGAMLSKLGMPSAFDGARADFGGMTADEPLKISDVFHKAFIKVTETGTEAAAATGVLMAAASASAATKPPVPFVADHPFLFFIRDDASGAVLFAGRVDDPTR